MKIESPEFEDAGEIPRKYGYTEENVNPPLEIRDVPEEAKTLVLIMDDPDAVEPAGKVWDHWLVWNLPGEDHSVSGGSAAGKQGVNDYGEIGYGGPNPPDGEHTYVFRLYALDERLELPEGASRDEVEVAIDGSVVEQAELRGRYSPV